VERAVTSDASGAADAVQEAICTRTAPAGDHEPVMPDTTEGL
jgi:hypothetical protein